MRIFGLEFHPLAIDRIRETIQQEPAISRRALSRRVCDSMGWRSPNGQLKELSCRKALLELDRRGFVQLPERSGDWAFQRPRTGPAPGLLPALPGLEASLEELGSLCVQPVTSRYSKASRLWKQLMEAHHYLGAGPLCGAQMRYLIRSERFGYLGGLAFSASAWRLKARDAYIGWTDTARTQNLQRVVNNSRFLILPTVRVPNLASRVLSVCAKRLPVDWEQRYGYRPVLVETFVERGRFAGTCYRAANWQYVGLTAGRGRQDDGRPCKDVYVYPLCRHWQQRLCTEPDGSVSIRVEQPTREPSDWTEEEFGVVDLGDQRLTSRLLKLASGFYAQPGASIPQALGSKAASKGAYRFFDNKRVDMDSVLASHYAATVTRITEQRIVLAVQDTTSLNYTVHPSTEGLGPIGTEQDKAMGLIVHDTMAFSPEGTPLGLIDVQCWARDPEETGKRHDRYEKQIEEKESFKWLKSYRAVAEIQKRCRKTTLISLSDRESDIYELFLEAQQTANGPKLVVRSERSRNRKVEEGNLWEKMGEEPVKGTLEVSVPRNHDRLPREAKLEIRFSQVELQPPKRKAALPPIRVWAVYALEVGCPADAKSLEWMLLTTVEVKSFEQALQIVKWYIRRWGIEVYHRVVKSGCRVEDRQLGTAQRIENCLAIDMVVAWRIHHLTFLGRETPDLPCTVFFEDAQWKALMGFINKNPTPPETPPTLREATRLVANLGGFLGRKSDGEPGTETIWRGLQRLDDITEAYKAFGPPTQNRSPPVSYPPGCG
jgi:hypothetical protein